ncbi:hypothetical protein Lal_00018914 [Lupinus albus]|nr:hypothetical protein Lal_00018914 [Lupinus albus]
MGDYSIHHQLTSSSHFQGTLPSIFGTTSTTSLSKFNYQQYYHPTMPSQVQQSILDDENDKYDEDDDEEDEEEPQLLRGDSGQPRQRQQQQQLRVQPPRRRKTPSCVCFTFILEIT